MALNSDQQSWGNWMRQPQHELIWTSVDSNEKRMDTGEVASQARGTERFVATSTTDPPPTGPHPVTNANVKANPPSTIIMSEAVVDGSTNLVDGAANIAHVRTEITHDACFNVYFLKADGGALDAAGEDDALDICYNYVIFN